MQALETGRLKVIDGWRALSVVLVIVHHLWINSHWLSTDTRPSTLLREMALFPAHAGILGVSIFFVISGFVISRGLIAESHTSHSVSIGAFYIRRCFRILPPLLLYVLAIFGLANGGLLPPEALTIPASLTFTCNLGLTPCGGWFGAHTWTLSVEEQFYLVFPVLFVAMKTSRGVISTAITLGIGLATFVLASSGIFVGYTLASFLCIAAGVLCALYEKPILRFCDRLPWVSPYLAILFVLMAHRGLSTSHFPTFTLLFPFAIAVMLATSIAHGAAMPWLKSPPIVLVGRASFGIYLWQQLATAEFEDSKPVFSILASLAAVIGPIVLYLYMERPLIEIGRRLSTAYMALSKRSK